MISPESRRIVLEAVIIVALGMAVGVNLHSRMLTEAFRGRLGSLGEAPLPGSSAYPAPVTLEEVRSLLEAGALAVDARAAELYREEHLPGALSLPLEEVEAALPRFRLNVPPERPVVIYCSGYGCPDSFDLGVRLLSEGYRDVLVFEGGLPAWRDAGLSIEASP